ncbi:acid protease [Xylariaceae sp. FL0016]|nr:acid protease [Xylariaceae sp. FL0016]
MRFDRSALTFALCLIPKCWAAGTEAIVISPSEYYDGNDGPWSSFFLRVGTPEQSVRVLVSTASPESMVVLSEYGCSTAAFETVPADCAVSRGSLFITNDSSTWDQVGDFGINGDGVGLEANLGYTQNARWGLDTVGLGLAGPSLDNQSVAGIPTAEPFYLGVFGLNNQPVNFSTLGNSTPSFITTLKDQQMIPSLSWSYTAGAQYRLKQVYAQLILSGYDTSRFTENSVTFTMADDLTRDLVVMLQSISYSGSTSAVLLSDPISIYIDSTDPNLWLPDSVCDAFEDAFGLTLDGTSGLYLVNETHHADLLNSDAEVTFRLSDVSEGGDDVTIVLPYDAFDLTAEYPLVDNTSYYFPLKRAANDTQYTLGRVFLQEAYLSANYEKGTFNVSACSWVEGAVQNVVTIPSGDSSTSNSSTGSSNGSSLGGGAIAGIVIGAVVGAILIGLLIALLIRRQRKKAAYAEPKPEPDAAMMTGPVHNAPVTPSTKYYSPDTIGTGTTVSRNETAAGNSNTGSSNANSELDGEAPQIYQLHGDSRPPPPKAKGAPVYHELGGNEIGRSKLDQVSTMENTPSAGAREETVPPSPLVSTLDTTGDRFDASSDLVSPTTPVNHDFRSSLPPRPSDRLT